MKFAAVQMIDVHLPTTDGRELIFTRCTQPEPDLQLPITRMKLVLPAQPPPKISDATASSVNQRGEDLRDEHLGSIAARALKIAESAKTG